MSDQYKPVREAMAAGTPHDLICGTCPWSRPCVNAPDMTESDVERQIKQVTDGAARAGGNGKQLMMAELTATAMFGGRDQAGTMCPVFIARLRAPEGRQLSDSIRVAMRGETA